MESSANESGSVKATTMEEIEQEVDYSKRGQWLRAAVLGANDGLLSTASLMMGVGAVRKDDKSMLLSGVAGLLAGACSMAIGEFVSVYSQYDTEVAQLGRDFEAGAIHRTQYAEKKTELPSPLQAAVASALSFAVGAFIPLIGAAFIADYKTRVGIVLGLTTAALILFGTVGAVLGRSPVLKSTLRVVLGGWTAMAITYGLTKSVARYGLS